MYTKYVFEFRTVQKCVDLVDLQNAAKTQLFEKFGWDQYTESGQTLQDVACVRSREMAVLNIFRGRGTFFDAESA